MDFLILLLTFIGASIAGIIANLIASDLYDRSPTFAQWIVRRAVLRLPEAQQVRCQEEWLSHLKDCTGKISKVVHACGCFRASYKLRNIAVPKRGYANRSRKRSILAKHDRDNHMLVNFVADKYLPRYWTYAKSSYFRKVLRHSKKIDPICIEDEVKRRVERVRHRNQRYISIKRLFRLKALKDEARQHHHR
jgi:hypothetical protein